MGSAEEKLIVLIPCFNEEDNIEATVASVRDVGRDLPLDVELVLIDDGSTDGTREIIERLARSEDVTGIYNPKNLGVGRSLLDTFERIPDNTWVTVLPGDNEVDFASIANFVAIRDDYDLILGYLQNPIIRPLSRRLFSFGYMKLVQTLYGFPYRYLNGMKLFRSDVFKGIEVNAAGHAFNSELIAKALLRDPHLRIGEASFLARGRPAGASKAIRPRAVLQAIREVAGGFRRVSEYRRKIVRDDGD